MSSEYTFRLAVEADRAAIITFMNDHWGELHPIVNLPDFFAYYYDSGNGSLRFALAEQNGKLAAIAGFTPASQAEFPDIWVSLWVADKTAKGSGLELMAALPKLTGCRTLACNNIRPETRPFYEFLGYTTGRVGHFYRLADLPHYAVANIQHKNIPPVSGNATLQLLPTSAALRQSGFVPPADANPYKDMWHIERRYYAYPRQQHEVYGVILPGNASPAALLATRTIAVEEACVLRISDFIGNPSLLPQVGAAIAYLMEEKHAEYAELYCAGIDAQTLHGAGFVERLEEDENILPNYLTPPLYKNIDFYYFTSEPQNFTLFKADGDQDRPHTPMT